jgi:Leucine-rich repeat (LRR) protein
LEVLDCDYNQLKSLEGIENLVNLEYLNCRDNQLTALVGIENLVKLIENNKNIKNYIRYDFINYDYNYDYDDYIELNNLFENLIDCDDNEIDEYIENIIKELNGYQKYVLK